MLKSEQIGTAEYRTKVNFWWVNQGKSHGKTYAIERNKNVISAPQKLHGRRHYQHWENIRRVRKGDIIFHYANRVIRAISIVEDNDVKEVIRKEDVYKIKEGLEVKSKYFDIDEIDYEEFKGILLRKDGPFDYRGVPKQGYLYRFSFEGAKVIRAIYWDRHRKLFHPEIEKYFKSS